MFKIIFMSVSVYHLLCRLMHLHLFDVFHCFGLFFFVVVVDLRLSLCCHFLWANRPSGYQPYRYLAPLPHFQLLLERVAELNGQRADSFILALMSGVHFATCLGFRLCWVFLSLFFVSFVSYLLIEALTKACGLACNI